MFRHSKPLIPQKLRLGLTLLSHPAPHSATPRGTDQPMQTGKLLPTTHTGKERFVTLYKAEPVTSMIIAVDVVAEPLLSCTKPWAKGTSGLMLLWLSVSSLNTATSIISRQTGKNSGKCDLVCCSWSSVTTSSCSPAQQLWSWQTHHGCWPR